MSIDLGRLTGKVWAVLGLARGAGRTVRLGLAIGADRVVAVELKRGLFGLRPGRVRARSLRPAQADGDWPDLVRALEELLEELDVQRATASVALLRPLAQVKVINVPPVRRRDLQAMIARSARRYFIVGSGSLIIDAAPLERKRHGESRRTSALCADAWFIDSLYRVLSETGIQVETITAASLALIEAARRLPASLPGRDAVIAVSESDWCEGLVVQAGVPCLFEPWSAESPAEIGRLTARLARETWTAEDRGPVEPQTMVVAGAEDREIIADVVTRETGAPPLDSGRTRDMGAAGLAAFGAGLIPEDAPALLPTEARAARQRRFSARVSSLAAAAILFVTAAGVLHLWDLRREFDAVAAARSAHATRVAEALEARRAAEAVQARLEALLEIEDATVSWTPAVAALARALPDSAYLLSLSGEGLSLRLAGVAPSASLIVPALEASPLLRDVSLSAARRRDEVGEGESFDLALAVVPDSARTGGGEPGEGG